MVKRIICEDVNPINISTSHINFNGETDLLIHFTDIHTGIEINNWKNVFNEEVLKQRIEKYISDILYIRKLHKSENA
jgi:hypothetical protein